MRISPPHLRVVTKSRRTARRRWPFRRLARSLGYAWEGIGYVTRTQANWRIHIVAAALVCVAAVYLQVSTVELTILALTVGGVLALEAMNTAIEATVDALGDIPSLHAKRAKDAAAAAVLIAAATSVVVGVAIFAPRLIALFSAR